MCRALSATRRGGNRQVDAARQMQHAPAFADAARQEIHRRRAGEAGDELRRGPVVDAVRRVVLDQVARLQHDDAVGERHRLDLVVRHVDDRVAELLVELLDLDAHLGAQQRIEIRQRLVEQERLRLADDGAPHRDALALSAGELARLALVQVLDLQDRRRLAHARLDLVLGTLAQPQPERHVLEHRLVRIERVILEHHRDVARARRQVVDDGAADRRSARR